MKKTISLVIVFFIIIAGTNLFSKQTKEQKERGNSWKKIEKLLSKPPLTDEKKKEYVSLMAEHEEKYGLKDDGENSDPNHLLLYRKLFSFARDIKDEKTEDYGIKLTKVPKVTNHEVFDTLYNLGLYMMEKDLEKAQNYALLATKKAQEVLQGKDETPEWAKAMMEQNFIELDSKVADILFEKEEFKKSYAVIMAAYEVEKTNIELILNPNSEIGEITKKNCSEIMVRLGKLSKELFDRKNYEELISIYDILLPKDDYSTWIKYTQIHIIKKDFEKAIKYLEKMYLQKKDAQTASNLGKCHYSMIKKPITEKEILKKPMSYFAQAYLLSGKPAEESEEYKTLISIYFREYLESKQKSVNVNDTGLNEIIMEAKEALGM